MASPGDPYDLHALIAEQGGRWLHAGDDEVLAHDLYRHEDIPKVDSNPKRTASFDKEDLKHRMIYTEEHKNKMNENHGDYDPVYKQQFYTGNAEYQKLLFDRPFCTSGSVSCEGVCDLRGVQLAPILDKPGEFEMVCIEYHAVCEACHDKETATPASPNESNLIQDFEVVWAKHHTDQVDQELIREDDALLKNPEHPEGFEEWLKNKIGDAMEALRCPLTLSVMVRPMLMNAATPHQQKLEFTAILNHIKTWDSKRETYPDNPLKCPISKEDIDMDLLVEELVYLDRGTKELIDRHLEAYKKHCESSQGKRKRDDDASDDTTLDV